MNRNGITTNLKTINLTVQGTGIEPINLDLSTIKIINDYVKALYNAPNISIQISNENIFELLKKRLEMEHAENKFSSYYYLNNPYIRYCKDDSLLEVALIIDSFIENLFANPNKWIEIYFFDKECNLNESKILFGKIFQRLRNEHSIIVHKFLPKFVSDGQSPEKSKTKFTNGKYFIMYKN
jgi:hypothetical protein